MVQLHLHTEYSLRDSLVRIKPLMEKAKSLGMTAIAVTEHGHLASALDFYMECIENDIKPIIGCEAYVVWDIEKKVTGEKKQHFTLLAKDRTGYDNLLELVSIASTDGFYYTPRIDLNLLEKYKEGLIAMSACSFKSVLYLYDESDEWAERIARKLKIMFGNDFYLEIMPHKVDFQKEHNLRMLGISESLGIPLVTTQDVHYLEPQDREVHDILMQIQGRDGYGVDTLFFPAEDESLNLFSEHSYIEKKLVHRAVDMSDIIGGKIRDYKIPVGKFEYPTFIPTEEILQEMCQ